MKSALATTRYETERRAATLLLRRSCLAEDGGVFISQLWSLQVAGCRRLHRRRLQVQHLAGNRRPHRLLQVAASTCSCPFPRLRPP